MSDYGFSTASLPSFSYATGIMLAVAVGPSKDFHCCADLDILCQVLPGVVHDSVRCA